MILGVLLMQVIQVDDYVFQIVHLLLIELVAMSIEIW